MCNARQKKGKRMDISLNLNNNYNLSVYNNLCLLNDSEIFSEIHNPKLKHPADIYLNRLKDILLNLQYLKSDIQNKNDNKIKTSLKNYILSLDSFYDNIFLIIKSLKKPNGYEHDFAHNWLKLNGYDEGEKFRGSTNHYHIFISNIMNKIKHDDPMIGLITLKDTLTNKENHGFFIGSIIKDGKIGPDPEIHEHYKNKRTSFSFNHFIKKTVGLIFLYSQHLNKVLFNDQKKYSDKKENNIYNLFNEVEMLENYFFPDEYSKPTSKFSKTANKLLLEVPKTFREKLPKDFNYEINTWIFLNERTNSASGYMPYFGNRIEE